MAKRKKSEKDAELEVEKAPISPAASVREEARADVVRLVKTRVRHPQKMMRWADERENRKYKK